MPRPLWKGAITFGLVHVPVNLYPGSQPNSLDLDLLDKRDFAPVGYRRVNKRTGKEVAAENIVKGYEYRKGEYVVVGEEDFRQANVQATQTVEIQSFIEPSRIAPQYFDTPYYLEPGKRGEKGYALLRETLRKTGRVGIAKVVIRTRQYVAAVMPVDRLLVLNTLRFAGELRPPAKLELPPAKLDAVGVSARAMAMAMRLIEDMSEDWHPETYKDTYRDDLLLRIEQKVKRGQKHEVEEAVAAKGRPTAQVIDLVALLKESLGKQGRGSGDAQPRRRAGARARPPAQRSRTAAAKRTQPRAGRARATATAENRRRRA
jgi:DNA end-binding protein Ku